MFERYKAFPIRDLNSWFIEMAEIAEKPADSSSLPKLELSLRNGSRIEGHILKWQQNSHESTLVIAGFANEYNKSEITFLPCHEVVALTFLEPDAYLKQYVLPAKARATGKLELKRAAKGVQEKLNAFFTHEVSLLLHEEDYPKEARWNVLQVLEMLPLIFEQLSADELGKALIKEKIKNIEVILAKDNATKLDHQQLQIQLSTSFNQPLQQEKERILKEIEGLL